MSSSDSVDCSSVLLYAEQVEQNRKLLVWFLITFKKKKNQNILPLIRQSGYSLYFFLNVLTSFQLKFV